MIPADARYLLFDLDGTLVRMDRTILELRVVARAILRFARAIPPWRVRGALWEAARVMQENDSQRPNFAVFVEALAAQSRTDAATIERTIRTFMERDFPRMGRCVSPVPGARAVLEAALARGFRLVLATNPVWPETAVRMRLAWGGVGDIPFQMVTHAETMTRCKPRPEYYAELLDRLGAAPESCVMIGNDAMKDPPASALGIRTILVETPGNDAGPADPRYPFVRTTLDQLRRWVEATPRSRPATTATATTTMPEQQRTDRAQPPRKQRKTMSKPCKLVCVTGPDGAGKTTQIMKISERLERKGGKKIAAVTIWDLMLDPTTGDKVLSRDPAQIDRYLGILTPTARTHFLFHCFHQALELARAKQPDLLLVNSYWYKYYATEVAHGGDPALLRQLAAGFDEPSVTFYLRVSPEEAFSRKAILSGYETGFADPKTEEAFVSFQRTSQATLEQLAGELGWIAIDGSEPADRLTELILERMDRKEGETC